MHSIYRSYRQKYIAYRIYYHRIQYKIQLKNYIERTHELAKLGQCEGRHPGDLKVKKSYGASLLLQSTGRGTVWNKNGQASGQAHLSRYGEFRQSPWSPNHAGRGGQKAWGPLRQLCPAPIHSLASPSMAVPPLLEKCCLCRAKMDAGALL